MKPVYLTFDCYGTLIDWKSGVLSALRDYPNVDPDEFFETWWQVDRRLTCDTAYRRYREVLALDFAEAFQSVGIAITRKKAECLADGLGDWTPFPDAPAALAAFRRLGFKLGILSNIDNELLDRSVEQLGVDIEVRITAEISAPTNPRRATLKPFWKGRDFNPRRCYTLRRRVLWISRLH